MSIPSAAAVLEEWISHFGGADDCYCEGVNSGRHCTWCGEHLEDAEKPDLDPAHKADCLLLLSCMILHGLPQRISTKKSKGT